MFLCVSLSYCFILMLLQPNSLPLCLVLMHPLGVDSAPSADSAEQHVGHIFLDEGEFISVHK